MKITFGSYKIESDGTCVTLFKERIAGEDSKTPGEVFNKPIGYFPNILQALGRLLEEKIGEADTVTVQDLREILLETKCEIKTKFEELKQAVINSKKKA